MELLDPNKIPDPSVDFKIPPDVRKKMEESWKMRRMDLSNQLALYELNISRYLTEENLCEDMGITQDQLDKFKRSHRNEIERYKEEHKYGKYLVYRAVVERAKLASALVQSRLENNGELAGKIKSIMVELDKVFPVNNLRSLAEILNLVDDDSDRPSGPQVNINVGTESVIAKAQEALERRKKEKIVDVEEEK